MLLDDGEGFIVCPFRRVTSLPCPGCGLTTSIVGLLRGEVADALCVNPLGIIALLALVASPFLLALKPDKCFEWWSKFEQSTSKGKGLLVLFLVIGLDWLYLLIHSMYGRL